MLNSLFHDEEPRPVSYTLIGPTKNEGATRLLSPASGETRDYRGLGLAPIDAKRQVPPSSYSVDLHVGNSMCPMERILVTT